VNTTYEEAKKCVKCGLPGEEVSKTPVRSGELPKGTQAAIIYCRTTNCPWQDTSWVVQINPDGSVPMADHSKKQDKQFTGLRPNTPEEKRILNYLNREEEIQRTGEGEINPRRI
jgi:hypothetical protein